MAKFGDLMSFDSKDIFKSASYLTYCHHDVTDLANHGMVKNTKTWISGKRNIIFLRNKKILNLCLRWHILRSYPFLAEVTFNVESLLKLFFVEFIYFLVHVHIKNGIITWLNFTCGCSTGNNILDPVGHCDQIIPLFGGHFKFRAVSWYMPKNPVGHRGW